MRRFTLLLAVAVLSFGFAPAPKPKPKPPSNKADLKALKGAWILSSYKYPNSNIGTNGVTVIVADGHFSFNDDDGVIAKYSMTLDATKTPKRLDLKGKGGDANGDLLTGIYRLDAAGWTFCFATEPDDQTRPTAFKTGRNIAVIVFNRKKP